MWYSITPMTLSPRETETKSPPEQLVAYGKAHVKKYEKISNRIFKTLKGGVDTGCQVEDAQLYTAASIFLKKEFPAQGVEIHEWEKESEKKLQNILGDVIKWFNGPFGDDIPVLKAEAFEKTFEQFCASRRSFFERIANAASEQKESVSAEYVKSKFRRVANLFAEVAAAHGALKAFEESVSPALPKESRAKRGAKALGTLMKKMASLSLTWGPRVYTAGVFLYAGWQVGLAATRANPVFYFAAVLCVAMLQSPYVGRAVWDKIIFTAISTFVKYISGFWLLPTMNAWDWRVTKATREVIKFLLFVQFYQTLEGYTQLICTFTVSYRAAFGTLPALLAHIWDMTKEVAAEGLERLSELVAAISDKLIRPLAEMLMRAGGTFWNAFGNIWGGVTTWITDTKMVQGIGHGTNWLSLWWAGGGEGPPGMAVSLPSIRESGFGEIMQGTFRTMDVATAGLTEQEVVTLLSQLSPEARAQVVAETVAVAGEIAIHGTLEIIGEAAEELLERGHETIRKTGGAIFREKLESEGIAEVFDLIQKYKEQKPVNFVSAFYIVLLFTTLTGIFFNL